ncbi:amino acid ABC transporter ATP-binding protein [Xanthobacter sp. V4C-4]|uniref:amino acid ABC transporter ATP-binding protein n=1 Tax=Xanthobacter cornucopiae TaxID=3119924 RepID=UPI00372B811D
MTAPAAPLIEFRNIHKWHGALHVLDGINLTVGRGEALAIIGPSGSGKSTLIRLVNRLETISEGEIVIDGVPTAAFSGRRLRALRSDIGFVFQQFNLYGHLNALDNVALALRKVRHVPRAQAEAHARALLERVGLADKAGHYPAQLSGGQQQRVAIARALATAPKIILFDEPTSALDPEMIGEVLAVIRELPKAGITILVVTHEMSFAREVADRVAFIDGGAILEVEPPRTFFSAPSHPRTRRFLQQLLSPLSTVEA